SRAPLEVQLNAEAPFALALGVRLSGGESRSIEVPFAPEAIGAVTATLTVRGDVSLDVPLSGEGVAPVDCASSVPCHRSQRDSASNTCVDEMIADGTACTSDNACLAQGQCLQGACVGTPVSCDDGDRCTVDACEPVGGCMHFASSCPEPP